MPELELALLRRGVEDLAAETQRCAHCHRHPLVGERVYSYTSGRVLCELCREGEVSRPDSSRLVHGPEFGHTMKIIDQRAA